MLSDLASELTLEHDETAVVMVGKECESTLRHVIYDREALTVTLRASNEAYSDRVVPSEEVRVEGAFCGVSAPQRAALRAQAQKRVDARGTGDFNRSRELATEQRRKLRLDADFVEELRQAKSQAGSDAKSREGAAPGRESGAEKEQAPYQPTKNKWGRMELHAMKLARPLEMGEFDLDGAEATARNEMFWGPKQALCVRDLVESIVESRAVKEVA